MIKLTLILCYFQKIKYETDANYKLYYDAISRSNDYATTIKFGTDLNNDYKTNWKTIMKTLYDNEIKKFDSIIYQKGANGEIIYAMIDGDMIYRKELTDLFVYEYLYTNKNKYKVLIDAGGVFVGYSNYDIIKNIIINSDYTNGIYIDIDDNKKYHFKN